MSLATKIEKYIRENKQFTLQELYAEFGNSYQKHSIRARVYESKQKIVRTGKGAYILAGAEIEAVIEQADSREQIFHISKANIFYDLVFLDIPYRTRGQRSGGSGNRNMAEYDLIDPEEFKEILKGVENILRTEESQVYFMIAGGKSSITESYKYIRMFDETGLQLNGEGSYLKLNKDGSICNMAQHLMPAEIIQSYSFDGKQRDCTDDGSFTMDFALQRPKLARHGGYPTEKPLRLLEQIIKQATRAGERVIDLFAGSGVTLEAALGLGRKAHGVELSIEAIKGHILPRLEKFATGTNRLHFQPSLF